MPALFPTSWLWPALMVAPILEVMMGDKTSQDDYLWKLDVQMHLLEVET